MSDMTVIHRENDAFAVLVRDHVVHVDQPSAGGTDAGPTPVELFVASLATCAAYHARRYLVRRGLPAHGLEVSADYAMSGGVPSRVTRIDLRLSLLVPLAGGGTEELRKAVEACTVNNSILTTPRIALEIQNQPQAA